MSNKLAVTIDGLHRVGNKAYITVDAVHRKVLKGFLTVDGVHKLCYLLGLAWKKYNCIVGSDTSTYLVQSGWTYTNTTSRSDNGGETTVYTSYTFNSSTGFVLGSAMTVDLSTWTGTMYAGGGTEISRAVVSSDKVTYYMNYATQKTSTYTTYSKGSTDYGTIYAEEDAYPDAENGYIYVTTFTSGGATYTVMRDPNTNTYYCYCLV